MPVFDDGTGYQLGAELGSALEEALRNDGWSEVDDTAPEKPADPFKGLSRADLNVKATELGITDAETLQNRQAVVDAILAKGAENA